MKFDISPFATVGPLVWGMTKDEVGGLIGQPDRSSRNRARALVELRLDIGATCLYDEKTERLVEVGFAKVVNVAFFDGYDIVAGSPSELITVLCERDARPLEGFGTILFPDIGLSLTGYLPEELEVKAATAFAPNQWDPLIPKMQPFRGRV